MAELKNRQWLLAARPQGIIKETDFRWNESTVPSPKDGELLIRNLAFSFDPTQRGWMSMDTYIPAIPIGQVMRASAMPYWFLLVLTRSRYCWRMSKAVSDKLTPAAPGTAAVAELTFDT